VGIKDILVIIVNDLNKFTSCSSLLQYYVRQRLFFSERKK
jgi:hypothetical protein